MCNLLLLYSGGFPFSIHMATAGYKDPHLVDPEVGTLCLARFCQDNNYYRAYIMQIFQSPIGVYS